MIASSKKSPLIVSLVGIALLAATLACNPMSALNQNQAPTPTLFVAPATTGGGTSGGGEGALAFASADSAGLSSFRSVFTLSYNGVDSSGNPLVGTLTFNQAHTTNPPAQQLTWTGEGNIGDPNMRDFQIVQIGDQTYSVTNVSTTPTCLAMSAGGNPPSQSPDQFLSNSDLSKARRILPDETVNGVLSEHWQFTKAEVTLFGGDWDSYTVDVWMAVDGKYTTKATFSGDGRDFTFKGGSGHVDWTYDVTEVNGAIDIQKPAGCAESASDTFPKMPDASDVISFGQGLSYFTASPIADVVAFYQATLPGLGWAPGTADTSNPAAASLTFTKDGKTATISITDAAGRTNVTVLIQ